MTMDTIRPDWSSLPRDLLISISKRLCTRLDILHLRAVCRSFRSTLPRPPNVLFPKSILSNLEFLRGPDPNDHDLFIPIESTLYAIQPLENETSQTWLVKVEESSEPGRVQIKDPLSGYRFKNLSKKLPKSLNLLDYRVTEMCKTYALESAAIRKGKAKLYENERSSKPSLFKKVIFSPSLGDTDDKFGAMVRFGQNKLSLWRNTDRKWTNNLEFSEGFCDIIYHNKKFYALAYTGLTITVDCKSLTVTEVAAGLKEDLSFFYLCWVESLKDLISIVANENQNTDDAYHVKFFRLNEEKREWVPVVDESKLEDIVFFRSDNYLCSVLAKEFPGCKGNSVYHTNDHEDKHDFPGQGACIYDLQDGKTRTISDFPGYSNLFWPPPSWLN